MTIEGVLFVAIALMLMLNWPVAIILVVAARQKPRIRALTVSAVLSLLIAIALTAYVFAVLNAGSGFVFPKETMQAVLRLVLLAMAAFPVWWLWLYLTGRFKD